LAFYVAMSATTVGLLKAASDILGGERALAERLGVAEHLLAKFLSDSLDLPDPLLLRAVDIILADRQPPFRQPGIASCPDVPDRTPRA
jgi:hypothetical protein